METELEPERRLRMLQEHVIVDSCFRKGLLTFEQPVGRKMKQGLLLWVWTLHAVRVAVFGETSRPLKDLELSSSS